jgi:hypothetical protein
MLVFIISKYSSYRRERKKFSKFPTYTIIHKRRHRRPCGRCICRWWLACWQRRARRRPVGDLAGTHALSGRDRRGPGRTAHATRVRIRLLVTSTRRRACHAPHVASLAAHHAGPTDRSHLPPRAPTVAVSSPSLSRPVHDTPPIREPIPLPHVF